MSEQPNRNALSDAVTESAGSTSVAGSPSRMRDALDRFNSDVSVQESQIYSRLPTGGTRASVLRWVGVAIAVAAIAAFIFVLL